jgi:hypothetical protein
MISDLASPPPPTHLLHRLHISSTYFPVTSVTPWEGDTPLTSAQRRRLLRSSRCRRHAGCEDGQPAGREEVSRQGGQRAQGPWKVGQGEFHGQGLRSELHCCESRWVKAAAALDHLNEWPCHSRDSELTPFAAMKLRIQNAKIACLDINLAKQRMHLGVHITIDDPEQLEAIRAR